MSNNTVEVQQLNRIRGRWVQELNGCHAALSAMCYWIREAYLDKQIPPSENTKSLPLFSQIN